MLLVVYRSFVTMILMLIASGALDDVTSEPGGDIQRQLDALSSGSSVDAELAKMKAELGAGAPAPKEISSAESPAAGEEPK
jgi:phage shock protein A